MIDTTFILEGQVIPKEKPKPFHPDHLKRMGVTVVEGDGV